MQMLELPSKHLSASQIQLYYGCGVKYYKTYVEGRKREKRNAVEMHKGTAVHKALQHLYDLKIHQQEVPDVVIKDDSVIDLCVFQFESTVTKELNEKVPDNEKDAFIKTVTPGVIDYTKNVYPNVTPLATELEFTYEYVDEELGITVPILMYFDLVKQIELDSTVDNSTDTLADRVICDYKLSSKKSKWSSDKLKRSIQFMLYSRAIGIENIEIHNILKNDGDTTNQDGAPEKNLASVNNTGKNKKTPKVRSNSKMKHPFDAAQQVSSFSEDSADLKLTGNLLVIQNKFSSKDTYVDKLIHGALTGIKHGIFLPATPDSWLCTPKWCEFYNECHDRGT